MKSRSLHLIVAAATGAALLAAAPAANAGAVANGWEKGAPCSPDASLLGFSDALDKTTFEGTAVSGLSALSFTGHDRALALVDNLGTTPARFYDLSIDAHRKLDVAVRKVTTLTRPDGTPYTGGDFDGEGLVAERGGKTILASSNASRRSAASDRATGKQLAELPVPARFRVAPAGEAMQNATFEALGVTPNGRHLLRRHGGRALRRRHRRHRRHAQPVPPLRGQAGQGLHAGRPVRLPGRPRARTWSSWSPLGDDQLLVDGARLRRWRRQHRSASTARRRPACRT